MENISAKLFELPLFLVPFLFSLCFHEFAHGWVARKRGDPTAQMMGRLTMNPMAHLDWVGTILFPSISFLTGLMLLGWAKPVPVNERNFKHPIRDMFWVASAGPLSNILLANVAIALFVYFENSLPHLLRVEAVQELLKFLVSINLGLAVFNLLPISPLDGGKILARFIPAEWNRRIEEHSNTLSMILMLLAFTGGINYVLYPVFSILLRLFEQFWRMVLIH